MTQSIIFTNCKEVPEEYNPTPATVSVPDWYKNLESYIGGKKDTDGKGGTLATAKRCMPLFDAIVSGYILYTYCDLVISQRHEYGKINGNTHPAFEWPSLEPLSFHPKEQLPEHPNGEAHEIQYPKWNNAWSIKTPPGYSCIFLPPLHRENSMIIFPGVVDTDTYHGLINLPFVLKDPKMEGLIPAGTPIAQVIPFKRDDWQMQFGDSKDISDQKKSETKVRSLFFDSYKKQFRQSKSYR